MATSGSIDFSLTRDNVIQDALELCEVIIPGATPDAAHVTTVARTLNMMLKHWQSLHINLFAVQKVYLFLNQDQHEYSISSASSMAESTTSFVATAINNTAGYAAGITSIVVDSITGISTTNKIGVEQSDGSMHWTTVNGAPSGSTIVLTAATTVTISDNALVYAYTTRAGRFRKVLEAYRHDAGDNTETPVTIISKKDYWEQASKASDGPVASIYYDPQITTGKLWVWPEVDNAVDYLILHVERTLEDLDAASNDLDFPQEWYLPIVYGVAYLSSPKFHVPMGRINMLRSIAEQSLNDAMDGDTEITSVSFEIDNG